MTRRYIVGKPGNCPASQKNLRRLTSDIPIVSSCWSLSSNSAVSTLVVLGAGEGGGGGGGGGGRGREEGSKYRGGGGGEKGSKYTLY